MYRIERWGPRGVNTEEALTKRQANVIAERMRGERDVAQTVVTFPNGTVRVCRNTHYASNK